MLRGVLKGMLMHVRRARVVRKGLRMETLCAWICARVLRKGVRMDTMRARVCSRGVLKGLVQKFTNRRIWMIGG